MQPTRQEGLESLPKRPINLGLKLIGVFHPKLCSLHSCMETLPPPRSRARPYGCDSRSLIQHPELQEAKQMPAPVLRCSALEHLPSMLGTLDHIPALQYRKHLQGHPQLQSNAGSGWVGNSDRRYCTYSCTKNFIFHHITQPKVFQIYEIVVI